MRPLAVVICVLALAGLRASYVGQVANGSLTSSGLVTTNEVIVGSQTTGRVRRILAKEGDAVHAGQLLIVLAPDEQQLDRSFFESGAAEAALSTVEAEAALLLQEQQTASDIGQAEALLAAAQSEERRASVALQRAAADYARAQQLGRVELLSVAAVEDAKAAEELARAEALTATKQAAVREAALAGARANLQQIGIKTTQLRRSRQRQAAAKAQSAKADVRLDQTEIRAPIDGVVDALIASVGEVVVPGDRLVTLMDPDALWVRLDLEESYVDRIRVGDRLNVQLAAGFDRPGVVFYRRPVAGFATQRNVSRTKRDIKTFEIRLRVDNRDRRLAVGMTASVELPR